MAMEANQIIFKAILEPLIVASVPEVKKKQCLDAQGAFESLVDEEIGDTIIAPRNRFCKFLSNFEYRASLSLYCYAFVLTFFHTNPFIDLLESQFKLEESNSYSRLAIRSA